MKLDLKLPDIAHPENQAYLACPWYRRDGFVSALTILGIFTGICLVPACIIVLTGPVYCRRMAKDGKLRTWGKGNKIAAVALLVLWLIGALIWPAYREVNAKAAQSSDFTK